MINKKRGIIKNKKAQAWSLDLIIASVIFTIAIGLLFYYALNNYPQSKNQLEEMFYDGNLASELILSDGESGILTQGKVNQTKLDNFDSLSDQDKKDLLGVRYNFYFTMDNLDYVGIQNTSDVDNLIQITRLTLYNDKPVKFTLYTWE